MGRDDLDQGLPIFLIPLEDSKDYELFKGKMRLNPFCIHST